MEVHGIKYVGIDLEAFPCFPKGSEDRDISVSPLVQEIMRTLRGASRVKQEIIFILFTGVKQGEEEEAHQYIGTAIKQFISWTPMTSMKQILISSSNPALAEILGENASRMRHTD